MTQLGKVVPPTVLRVVEGRAWGSQGKRAIHKVRNAVGIINFIKKTGNTNKLKASVNTLHQCVDTNSTDSDTSPGTLGLCSRVVMTPRTTQSIARGSLCSSALIVYHEKGLSAAQMEDAAEEDLKLRELMEVFDYLVSNEHIMKEIRSAQPRVAEYIEVAKYYPDLKEELGDSLHPTDEALKYALGKI
eukprot:1176891-Prorocentrum_minimum.AAC.3